MTKKPSHLTFSIQATALGTVTNISHHDPTYILLLPQRLMGNFFTLQKRMGNPTCNLHPFSCRAPPAQSSPSGAEQVHALRPQSPAPATPCPSCLLSPARPPSVSWRCRRSTVTGLGRRVGPTSFASDHVEAKAPGWKPPKRHPFYIKVLLGIMGSRLFVCVGCLHIVPIEVFIPLLQVLLLLSPRWFTSG